LAARTVWRRVECSAVPSADWTAAKWAGQMEYPSAGYWDEMTVEMWGLKLAGVMVESLAEMMASRSELTMVAYLAEKSACHLAVRWVSTWADVMALPSALLMAPMKAGYLETQTAAKKAGCLDASLADH
jgi:hypothetical protein